MEVEEEINNYVIQTLGDSDVENHQALLDSSTIILCSEDGKQTQCVPYGVENGQIILKIVEDDPLQRLEHCEVTAEVEKTPKENSFSSEVVENKNMYVKTYQKRRKMSYENDFKPCSLPPNRGGIKGLIRYGRKHLIIDQKIMIAPREFKAQLNSTEDIIMKSELAPCTKQQMRHILSGMTRLFAYPAHKMPSNQLLQLYVSNCTTRKQPNCEVYNDMNLLPLGYKMEVDTSKIKRITRKRRYPEAEEYLRQQSLAKETNEIYPTEDIQQLLDAANTASTDHGYTNKVQEVFIKPDYVQEIKKEPEQIYIMQSVDESGAQSNIEVLLAAAEETNNDELQYHQIQIKNEDENNFQQIYIVQDGTEEVLCVPTEYILP